MAKRRRQTQRPTQANASTEVKAGKASRLHAEKVAVKGTVEKGVHNKGVGHEKSMSLSDLYSFGYEIFGDREEFNNWIVEPLSALGGQAPNDLLKDDYGREEVKNLIGRIGYGIYS